MEAVAEVRAGVPRVARTGEHGSSRWARSVETVYCGCSYVKRASTRSSATCSFSVTQ